jgi:hypothetical protein
MRPLPDLLRDLGAAGLRLTIVADRLHVRSPDLIPREDLDALRAEGVRAKAAVARMDAGLAEALATLDALAARPGTSPARLEVIRLRAEVYRECRDRLDQTDLADDAKHFAARILNPPPRDHGWLDPRDCRPSTTQEANR